MIYTGAMSVNTVTKLIKAGILSVKVAPLNYLSGMERFIEQREPGPPTKAYCTSN
ncbi:Uncharacterised protein [uncultured archaeon]|nr:Uncharacterised protein [uncultured archaeon]